MRKVTFVLLLLLVCVPSQASLLTISGTGNISSQDISFDFPNNFCCDIPEFDFSFSTTIDTDNFDAFESFFSFGSVDFLFPVVSHEFSLNGKSVQSGFNAFAAPMFTLATPSTGSPLNEISFDLGQSSGISASMPRLSDDVSIDIARLFGFTNGIFVDSLSAPKFDSFLDVLLSDINAIDFSSNFILRDRNNNIAFADSSNVSVRASLQKVTEVDTPSSTLLMILVGLVFLGRRFKKECD